MCQIFNTDGLKSKLLNPQSAVVKQRSSMKISQFNQCIINPTHTSDIPRCSISVCPNPPPFRVKIRK